MAVERPEKFGIGRVFDNSFSVIGRNIGLCVGLALLFSGLPAIVIRLWSQARITEISRSNPSALADGTVVFGSSIFTISVVLITFIFAFLLQSSLVKATIEDMNGKRPAFGECIQIAFRYLLPTVGIGLLVSFGAGLASLALLVPGVILWLGWSVAVPVLIQERLGVFGSMSRSRALTRGSRWSLFWLYLVLFILTMVIQGIAGVLVYLFHGIVADVAASLVQTVVSMVLSVAAAVSYVELRQVKEGASVSELAEIFS